MMIRFFASVMLSVYTLAFLACSDAPAPHDAVPEMTFTVDPERLGPVVDRPDLGVRFQPPRAWEAISSDILLTLSDRLGTDALRTDSVALTPVAAYAHMDGSLLILSSVQVVGATADEQRTRYERIVDARFPAERVQKGRFSKDGLVFTQYLIQQEGHISFKLFSLPERVVFIQFDYIVPRESYGTTVRSIESSIGSIALSQP